MPYPEQHRQFGVEGLFELPVLLLALALVSFGQPALAQTPEPGTQCPAKPSGEDVRRIAITLDDAPKAPGARGDWDRAKALIAALAEMEVTAAFFATTKGLQTVPDGHERLARYAAAGHLIANHTHTHPRLDDVTADAFLSDVVRSEEHLSGFANRRMWFRFPYLDQGRRDTGKRQRVREGLAKLGLVEGYVTVDTYDWHFDQRWSMAIAEGLSVDEAALERVYAAMVVDAAEHAHDLGSCWVEGPVVHVLLLHENDAAATFLPAAIDALRQAGWIIVDPDEAYLNPLPEPDVGTSFTGMGRLASLAWEAGARGAATFDHWSASAEGIDMRLTQNTAFATADGGQPR